MHTNGDTSTITYENTCVDVNHKNHKNHKKNTTNTKNSTNIHSVIPAQILGKPVIHYASATSISSDN